jgi:hypothetical protein
MKVALGSSIEPGNDVTIVVDSSRITVSNRGEWIRHKWKVKRGFIKVHIAVDTRTKQIIAMEITKEEASDGRTLERLVDDSARKALQKRRLGRTHLQISIIGFGGTWISQISLDEAKKVILRAFEYEKKEEVCLVLLMALWLFPEHAC